MASSFCHMDGVAMQFRLQRNVRRPLSTPAPMWRLTFEPANRQKQKYYDEDAAKENAGMLCSGKNEVYCDQKSEGDTVNHPPLPFNGQSPAPAKGLGREPIVFLSHDSSYAA